MDFSVYDVFSNARNILYLGNYQGTESEIEATEINEEDIIQVIKRKFYLFLSYLEDNKQNELNDLLSELKEDKDQKMFFHIFKFYTIFSIKGQYKADVLDKFYNDLYNIDSPGAILQPAIYIVSLVLLEIDDRDRFLKLVTKIPDDIELLLLKGTYLLKMNRFKETEDVIAQLQAKDTDSIACQILQILLFLLKDSNIEKAISVLAEVKRNNKITPKLFNLIAITLIFKGNYSDALKPLLMGIETCEKNGIASQDLSSLYVNLICCYRNLGMENEIRDSEEKLRNSYSNNVYFMKLKEFDDEFDKMIKIN